MGRLVPFRRWHLDWIKSGGEAVGGEGGLTPEVLAALERQNSWTAVVDDAAIACGGTMLQWPGRHIAWVYLNAQAGPHMGFITKAVLKQLEQIEGRVELTVRKDFEKGHRWARMLGFKVETPTLEAFGPLGEDHVGYVRFNKG